MKGGKKVIIEPHRFAGIFIARGNDAALITKNMVPGEAVYGEKRITVEVRPARPKIAPPPPDARRAYRARRP